MTSRWHRRSLVFALVLTHSASASAVPHGPARSSSDAPLPSLLDRIGIARVEQALRSPDARERERALSRLGAFGTARALELLVRALDPNGAAQSSRERLIAVRLLAPHVKVTPVRECLVRVMTGISAGAERAEPLQALLRDTAALSLAASDDASALEALGKALRQPGRVAQAAGAALAAHPPEDLSALARAHYSPSADLVRAFEDLHDERAFELLRDVVRRAAPELQADAAVVLTRLGNFETVSLAHRWSTSENATLRLAAVEILLLARDAKAPALVDSLLKEPDRAAAVLELLRGVSDFRLEAPLLALLKRAEPSQKPAVLAALSPSAQTAGLAAIAELVADPTLGDRAAYALASARAAGANAVLNGLLRAPKTRRLAARAAILRAYEQHDTPRELAAVLEQLAQSPDAKDRALGVYGLSLLQRERCVVFLKDKDPVVVQAAARAAPFVGAAREAAQRLSSEPAGPTRTQLALALIDPAARSLVPVQSLLSLVEEGGVAAPLALFSLGSRDSTDVRARLLEFENAPDPWLRSALALALGESPTPSARSLLARDYRFEPDADVRHAQIVALARRPEASRREALRLAATLDPDARVREAARLGLASVRSQSFKSGFGTLWLALENSDPERIPVASVGAPGGLALPVLADPEGVVLLAGLPEGKVSLRLALEPRERKAPPEDR